MHQRGELAAIGHKSTERSTARPKKLLSVSADSKTVKGEKLGYLTGILYLAPGNMSGREVCPMASDGCRASCLGHAAGRVVFLPKIMKSRIAKTNWYFDERDSFMLQLEKDIEALVRKAAREGLTPVVRLNGSSDIPWERVGIPTGYGDDWDGGEYENIMSLFPDVQFYDYTKRPNREDLPANYHLTFSMAEDNDMAAFEAIGNGMNVAVVFFDVPKTFTFGARSADDYMPVTYPVIDGDASDLRFLDDDKSIVQGMVSVDYTHVVIGLKAKGAAKKDTSGFVR